MTRIKCCGMMRREDIDCVNRLRPEYAGFILAKGRRRTLTLSQATALRERLDAGIAAVGVYVDAPLAEVCETARAAAFDVIQLHGQEDDAYIAAVRERTGLPVIRAFRVASEADVRSAQASTAEYILLDNGAGGTGSAFDWRLLGGVKRPFFLAGGITPENARRALELKPYALDVSSGIETNGYKDEAKMARLIDAVRGIPERTDTGL